MNAVKLEAGRDLSVDTLRGIACVLLVTMHVIAHDTVPMDHPARLYGVLFEPLRMPLFVFLSGFVYAWRPLTSRSGYFGFMGKKARRLLVPYVLFVPALGLLQAISAGETGNVGPATVVDWLLTSVDPYWFLLSTFWMFAVVALADSLGLLNQVSVVLAVAAAVVVVNLTTPVRDVNILVLGDAVSLFPFFLLGIVTCRADWGARISRWVQVILVGAFAALFVYVAFGAFGIVAASDARSSLVGIAVGMIFPVMWLSFRVEIRWLAWIGGYSSGIFLVHAFALPITRIALFSMGIDHLAVVFAVCSVVGIFGSIGVVKVMRLTAIGRVILGEKARRPSPRR